MPPWQPVREVVTESKKEKGEEKIYRKKLHRKREKENETSETNMLSRVYCVCSCSLFLSHAIILAEILVSLCNMHPDLNDMWEERERETERTHEKDKERKRERGEKEETETKWEKERKRKKIEKHDTESRFHKLLRSFVMYTLWVHICC